MLSTVPFLTDSALPAVTVFTAQGRYGNNALNGDWEVGLTRNTNGPIDSQAHRRWANLNQTAQPSSQQTVQPEPFSFTVKRDLAATFTVGGTKVAFGYGGQLTANQPNAIKIWAKASTDNSGLTIDNFKLTTPGMAVPMEFPGASITVSRSSGPDFQQLVIAGVDFTSGSGPAVELTGNVLMSFGAPAPRGSSLQFHVMAVYVPPVDLDVNSDNSGSVLRSAFEELEEDAGVVADSDTPTKPGLVVPVGGPRAEMVVEVPAGRTATLALSQGTEWVKVYAQPTGGDSIDLPLTLTNTALRGSTTFTYWIDAVAPSESMADIAFTLTTSDAGPASSDTVRATTVAGSVDLEIIGLDANEEDFPGGLVAVNNNRDEDNYAVDDTPLRDNEADADHGQRILGPNDADLLPVALHLSTSRYAPTTGSWSLSFPDKIRVWRRDGDEYVAVAAGAAIEDMSSDSDYQPTLAGTQTIDLLIEGIAHSSQARDIAIASSLDLDRMPGQTFRDAVSLTAPKLERVAWDPTTGEIFDASDKIPASDFRPEVSLGVTQARLDSVGNLIVDLSVSVADELSGLLDDAALRINGLTLYANNVPVAQISGLAASHLVAGAVPWQPHGFRGVTQATVVLPPPAVTGTWGGATCVLRAQTTANAAGHAGWDQATVVIGWRPESEWSASMGNPDRAGSIRFDGDGQPSQVYIPIVELIQDGVGSAPGAAYPWMMRLTALDDELAAKVAVSIDNVPQELAPFTFSPRQHYVIKPGRPGPKLFVLTSDELTPEALQAITPGQIQPARHGDEHAFRVIGPQGQPLANVKVSAAVHEERLLPDEVGGINLPSPTVNDLGNLLRLFQILHGDAGVKALGLFDKSGGHLAVRQFALGWPLSNGMSYDTRSDDNLEILVDPDVDVMQAAQFLGISLERALGTRQVLRVLGADADTFRKAYAQTWRNSFAAVAAGANFYINGIGVVFEPVDVVITVNELSQGNLHAAIGFIPFISGSVLKQGAKIVVKNGDNVIVSMTKQVADAIGIALKKTDFQDQLRYLVENTSVAQRQVLLDAKILVSASKRISPRQYLRGLDDDALDPDFVAEQIKAFNTFKKRELHHDLPFEFKDWFLVRGVDVNEIYTLRFVEGSLKENTPAFKAKWRYHQSWDLRAGGFHSQWDSWIKANPEATRDQILAKMEELRAAFPAGGILDTR
jgi:hypothetical protein